MAHEIHHQTQALIRTIEKKDRRFRIAQTLFMITITAAIAAGAYFVVNGFNNDQKARDSQTNKIIQAQSDKIDDLGRQIKCVVTFFQKPDRQNLVVTDPKSCFTKRIGDNSPLTTSPAPNNASENNTKNTKASQGTNTQTAPDQTNPPDVGSGGGEQPPKEVLGIPVCVPLTNTCLR